MEINQLKNFVKNVELFSDLDDKERDIITSHLLQQNFPKDSLLFVENTPRKYLWIIYEGEVELFKKTPFGEEKRLGIFTKYDFLGEGSLIDEAPLRRFL
jgi:CRP-like cAMP-binding protein